MHILITNSNKNYPKEEENNENKMNFYTMSSKNPDDLVRTLKLIINMKFNLLFWNISEINRINRVFIFQYTF